MLRCTDQPLPDLLRQLQDALRPLPPGAVLRLEAPDPDLRADLYPGEPLTVAGLPCRYRPHETWLDLAEVLGCTVLTPRPAEPPGFLVLGLRKLDPDDAWHRAALPTGHPEKYGVDSDFARTSRLEEPAFVDAFRQGLRFLRLPAGARVLAVGANRGDELALAADALEAPARLLGVDHSASAIAEAQRRHPAPPFAFGVADLRVPLPLPVTERFDLILAINVLHSPALDGQAVFRRLLADRLAPGGGMILGFPSGQHVDHRLRLGARSRNYSHPEWSVLLGVGYYRRVLQRRGAVVTLTGKQTLLLTARSVPGAHAG